MVDHHIMGGGNAALEESYFLFYLSWLKVDHHMMGGGNAAFHPMTLEQSQHWLTLEQSQFF